MTSDAAIGRPLAVGPTHLAPLAGRLIGRLEALVAEEDRGALAQLRRSAGKAPGEAAGAFQYVAPYIPDSPGDWLEICRYLVAGLFALHPPAKLPNGSVAAAPGESFGSAVYRMSPATADNRKSVERRFSQLLVADSEELPDRLRQMIMLLRSVKQPVDWRWLLADLERWRARGHRVQRGWAKDFWRLPDREPGDGDGADG